MGTETADGGKKIPSTSMKAASAVLTSALWTPPRAAYIHMPFCRRRCFYCDFPIQVVGSKQGAADAAAETYCALLRRELDATPQGEPQESPLESLYFGGGTPSLTPPALLADVIEAVRRRHGLAEGCEVTLEMDPGTFDAPRLAAFLDAGVTRVSLGVQSFDAQLLEKAGRAHDMAAAEQALTLLRDAHAADGSPLRSFSIDLIGGLPFQTRETWQASLQTAASCGAHHVSVYDLQVEQRTAFGRWYEPGAHPLPTEEDAANMYRDASAALRDAGFDHYEVSNFARPGHRSRHNQAYWRNDAFLGLGLGATSHLAGVRLARPRTMSTYSSFVDELEATGFDAMQERDGVREEGTEALTTRLMLALRTRDGASEGELAERFGPRLAAATAAACRDAADELPDEWIADASDGRFALTDPDGFLFSNEAISTVFARLDERLDNEEEME